MEAKDEIRVRIGRSTDRGDAVVQAFWKQSGSWADVYGVVECGHCGRKFYKERKACPQCGQPADVPVPEDEVTEDEVVTPPEGYPAAAMAQFATVQSATTAAKISSMGRVFPQAGGQW